MQKRIAMWSGPRNISTAMLRSWGNRPDSFVCDEPLYAHYLVHTGLDHPGREEVIRHHETDLGRIIDDLTGPIPEGKSVYYQKHMAHHLLPDIDRDWLGKLVNCFLIRDPREMLTSLLVRFPDPTLSDTGLPQQVEIFESVREAEGRVPPVIDAADVLGDPESMLRRLCEAVGLDWWPGMLRWPAGRRKTDGIWAPHWYDAVERSTGFKPYRPKPDPVPDDKLALYERCLEFYRALHPHRLRPAQQTGS